MKVLTIKQPWACLIVNGYKEYEFRTWKTNYRGKILIHAGKIIDKYNLIYLSIITLIILFNIIGEVEIKDCILVDDKMQEKLDSNNTLYMVDQVT